MQQPSPQLNQQIGLQLGNPPLADSHPSGQTAVWASDLLIRAVIMSTRRRAYRQGNDSDDGEVDDELLQPLDRDRRPAQSRLTTLPKLTRFSGGSQSKRRL